MSNPVVVKLGGTSATDLSVVTALARELAGTGRGCIVHGGGKEVSALSEQLGYTPRFENGIRMTTDAEMNLVEMVLTGLVNKRIVRTLCAGGIPAIGISGSDGMLVTGTALVTETGARSRTGRPSTVHAGPLEALWAAGYLPVVAPPSTSDDGIALNINADDVAFALATEIHASALVFLSDVPGVLVDGAIEHSLDADAVAARIRSGAISGGMIPKVTNAVTAVSGGVERVVIGQYEHSGDLQRLMSGSTGTSITDVPAGAQGGNQ